MKATIIRILAVLGESREDMRDSLTTEIKKHNTKQAKVKMQ